MRSLEELPGHEPSATDLDWMVAAEARCDVATVLRLAPAPLVASLLHFRLGGEAIKELAEEIGMSRFKLGRQLDGFKREMQMRMAA